MFITTLLCGAFAVQPPTISLNLDETELLSDVQSHACGGVTYPTEGHAMEHSPCDADADGNPSPYDIAHHMPDGSHFSEAANLTATAEAYGKACNVLTDTAMTCAKPNATAFDHHEGNQIEVVETVMLYIASWPRYPPVQVFQAVENIDYAQRGEYILYYDAEDSSHNHAEQLAFGMIMQDHVVPEITTDLSPDQTIELEACYSASWPDGTAATRTMYELPHTAEGTFAEDDYDGDVSQTITASSVFSESGDAGTFDISTRVEGWMDPPDKPDEGRGEPGV
jgi:hypothetical protein